jgi:N-acetylglucosamine repressor
VSADLIEGPGLLPRVTSVRAINRARIISLIRRNPGLMRADVSHLSGLSKATVSSLVDELLTDKFLYEDVKEGARQRRVSLYLNRDAGAVVGLEVYPGECRGIVADMSMRELGSCVKPLSTRTVSETVDTLASMYQTLVASISLPCRGAVVSVPGPTAPSGQTVVVSPNMGWTDVPLARMLSERLGAQVSLVNTPRAMTLGEYWYGAGVSYQDMVHVNVSSGIGAGIIVHGQMLNGAYGYSSEIGHTTILPDGPLCACGNYGCLEALASLPAIITQARAQVVNDGRGGDAWCRGDVNDATTSACIIKAAQNGDSVVSDVVRQASQYLGIAVANLIDLFNPRMVLIGGQLAEAGELVIGTVREVARRRSLSACYNGVEISRARLGANAGCIGACALVIDRYVAEIEPAIHASSVTAPLTASLGEKRRRR